MEFLSQLHQWIPAPVLLLVSVLNFVYLLHALSRRDWFWACWLAIPIVLNSTGILTVLFYTFSVALPAWNEHRGQARRRLHHAVSEAQETLKTTEMKIQEAEEALSASDTLQNRTWLAKLQVENGELDKAQATIEPLLHGVFSDDGEVLLAAASIDVARAQHREALEKLQHPNLDTAATRVQKMLLLAQVHEALSEPVLAEGQLRAALKVANGEEPRFKLAEFLHRNGKEEECQGILKLMLKLEVEASPLYRRQERPWFEAAARLRRKTK